MGANTVFLTLMSVWTCLCICCPRVRPGHGLTWVLSECLSGLVVSRAAEMLRRSRCGLSSLRSLSCPPIGLRVLGVPVSLLVAWLHRGALTPERAVWFVLWRTLHLVAKDGNYKSEYLIIALGNAFAY